MAEWFETFFEGLYQQVLPKQFDAAASLEQAKTVKRLLKVRKGQRVLDVPCGCGRITIPLAQMGIEMTGFDLTAGFLRRARRDARKAGATVRFIQGDMRQMDFDGEFHGALNWFTSFGYFSDEENLDFLRRVWRALRPGGRFLLELMNRSWLQTHFRPEHDQTVGSIHIAHKNRLDPATGRIDGTWTMTRGKTVESHRIHLRLFNGTDIRKMLRQAGFRDIQLHAHARDGATGRMTRHTPRFIAVATKPR